MSDIITLKIDVTKIDKARLFKGAKGVYLELVAIPTPNSEYGDYMIKQSVTQEERERKIQMPILGNAKVLRSRKEDSTPTPKSNESDEDVPF